MHKIYSLWECEPPFFNKEYGDFVPSITDYTLKSDKKTSSVIVIPGGGYGGRADDHEGIQICRMLNENGISAFILNYRVAPYSHPAMDEDAKRAVRFVRYNAKKFNIDKEKIGIIGFSAGGHLTCMTGLIYDEGRPDGDEIDRESSRPHTVAPCYAVSSLCSEFTHEGTKRNYAGKLDSPENLRDFSAEFNVKDDAPPFFIWHTAEDEAVDVRLSLNLCTALKEKNIPFELNIFPFGAHGLGLAKTEPLAGSWTDLYIKWLRHYGY